MTSFREPTFPATFDIPAANGHRSLPVVRRPGDFADQGIHPSCSAETTPPHAGACPSGSNALSGHTHQVKGNSCSERAEPVGSASASSEDSVKPVSLYFTLNEQGRILAVNAAGAASLGFEAIALVGQSILDLLSPSNAEGLQSRLLKPERNHSFRQVIQFIRKDQEPVLTMASLQPLQGEEGSLTWLLNGYLESAADTPLETALQQLEESERIRGALAQLTASFSRDIRHSLELHKILRTTVCEVQQILHADRVLIYRISNDDQQGVLTEAVAQGCTSILGQSFSRSLFTPTCRDRYQSGEVRAFSDLKRDVDLTLAKALQPLSVRAKLVAPIQNGEQLWGLLIAHQCHQPRSWQGWEMELMSQIASQVEIAIQQSELYQQVQRLNANLERQIQLRTAQLQLAYDFEATLKRITDKVRDSLDEDQILQAAVQELATVIGVGACNAAIYDLEEGTSTIRYEYTTTVSPSQGRVAQLSAFPEIYGQLFQGHYLQFCSVTPNPVRGHVSMLSVPILDDKGVLGDLWLINHKYYAFSDQDIRLVQQVANQCAIAIRQARLFQAAQSQVKELEKLNRLKDDFLSTVSHELRTPMSNIKMAIQMLDIALKQSGVFSDEPNRATRYFQILNDECQREIRLINDLLDLSRLDAGTEVFTPTPINLPTWIVPILQPFQERTLNHKQVFELNLPKHLPIVTDPGKLERVLVELLTNACKYTPAEEHIILTVQVLSPLKEVHLEAASQERDEVSASNSVDPVQTQILQIQIANTGVEIAPEELPRIFEKFYRIPNNDPWQYGGTGLGLALVKKLMDYLGGTITVISQDKQTCFTLNLPLQSPIQLSPEGSLAGKHELNVELPTVTRKA